MGCYQASAELEDELIILIRCDRAGNHLKHAGTGLGKCEGISQLEHVSFVAALLFF